MPRSHARTESYLLRTGRHAPALDRAHVTPRSLTLLQHAGPQPSLDEAHDAPVRHTVLEETDEPFVVQRIEEATNVRVEHPLHSSRFEADRQRVERLMRAAPGPEPVREAEKVRFVDGVQHVDDGPLDERIFQRRHAERPLPPVHLRDVRPTNRACPERAPLHAGGKARRLASSASP
jgi:hypothetical protein